MNKKIVAIQADPLSSLKLQSDSSLFIASEFCAVGYDVFFYTPSDLAMTYDQQFLAKGSFVDVWFGDYKSAYSISKHATIDLREADIVMIRQDPPFNMNYITNCYILEQLEKCGPRVINSPVGIRKNSEKMSTYNFPQFIPPSLIIGEFSELVEQFVEEHGEVIIKPLYWFGGQFLEKITNPRNIERQIKSAINQHGHIILQKFLSAIYDGDKRIIIINGKVAAAMKRIPVQGNFIANLAAGGSAAPTDLTERETYIAESVGAYLKGQGILLAGLDMIAEFLIEINVTSPTGLVAINKLYGTNLAKDLVEILHQKITG